MKVLIISSTVSQSISVGKIATELESFLTSKGNDVMLRYLDCMTSSNKYRPIGTKGLTKLYYHLTVRSGYRYHWSPFSINQISRLIKRYSPEIIQLIQPLPGYIDNIGLFKLLGNSDIPCIYTMIDENAYLGDCDNAYDCPLFIKGCQYCDGTNEEMNYSDYKGLWNKTRCRNLAKIKEKAYSYTNRICYVAPEWVVSRAKQSYLLRNKTIFSVDEYVNNKTIFYPKEIKPSDIKWEKYGIDTRKVIILNVARYSNTRKGVGYFIQLAERLRDNDKYLFVNVGFDGDINSLPKNYVGISFINDQNLLAEFYTLADLYLITSLSDTMPNACLEALSCGTPICGFDITGIPYVADKPIGKFVEPKNIDSLERVILETEKKDENLSKKCRNYALYRYSPDVYGQKMLSIYRKMLKDKRYYNEGKTDINIL